MRFKSMDKVDSGRDPRHIMSETKGESMFALAMRRRENARAST